MRLYILPLLFLGVLGSCQDEHWTTYTNNQGNYRIAFPYPPDTTVSVWQAPGGYGVAHSQNVQFGLLTKLGVIYQDLDKQYVKESGHSKIFESTRDRVVREIHGTVISEHIITLDSFPGTSMLIRFNDGIVNARLYLVGTRLYNIVISSSEGYGQSAKGDRFLNSFQLLH